MKQGNGTHDCVCVCIQWTIDYNLKDRWLGTASLNMAYLRSPARSKGEATGSPGRKGSQTRVHMVQGS